MTSSNCSHPIMHSDDSGTYCSWCGKLLAANKLWPELEDTSLLARHQNRLGDWSVLKNDGHWWVRYLRGVFALTREGWQRAEAEREMRARIDGMIRERDMAKAAFTQR
jgi:hypothetical protein